jgi:uncharacterized protein YggE
MSIETSGTATASMPCQHVVLELTLRRRDRSSRIAREHAKELLERLHAKLRELAKSGVHFDKEGMSARFSLETVRQRDSPAYEYEGVYRLTLSSPDHARFIEIFDAVTDVEGVEATSPSFRVDATSEQELRNDAFRAAVAHAKAKFAFQCRVIGLDPTEFEVSSWTYGVAGAASLDKRLHVEPTEATTSVGAVSVTLTIRLTHERKAMPPRSS